jgi:hypothetical protein
LESSILPGYACFGTWSYVLLISGIVGFVITVACVCNVWNRRRYK